MQWYAGSDHEGDWVITIGGYHSAYTPLSHYPAPPPHIAISWKYDDELSVTGEAYFALTTQVVMGGGRLDARVDKGWLRASFSAYANFLMHFHYFQYQADVGVSVSASATTGPHWLPIHIGPIEISASVNLHGPPIAG